MPANLSTSASNGADISELEKYFHGDLVCLVKALKLMPNVRNFIVSDRRWEDSSRRFMHSHLGYGRRCMSFTVESDSAIDQQKVMVNPRP